MGNSQATPSDGSRSKSTREESEPFMGDLVGAQREAGYRVLAIEPNSPAAHSGLIPYFDFIVAAAGVPLNLNDATLTNLIKGAEEASLSLVVYNWKSNSYREVIVVPSSRWAGEGLLGVTIRFDSLQDVEERLCHVLEVTPDSPAELAGLQAEKDFILGTFERVLGTTDELVEELVQHNGKTLDLFVYDASTDCIRTVVLMPTREWPGEGLLGADIAHGYLHMIPHQCCKTHGRFYSGMIPSIRHDNFIVTSGDGDLESGLPSGDFEKSASEQKVINQC